MWPEHFLEAKKCLAMYEQAMNNRELEVAKVKASELEGLAIKMWDAVISAWADKALEDDHGNPQG